MGLKLQIILKNTNFWRISIYFTRKWRLFLESTLESKVEWVESISYDSLGVSRVENVRLTLNTKHDMCLRIKFPQSIRTCFENTPYPNKGHFANSSKVTPLFCHVCSHFLFAKLFWSNTQFWTWLYYILLSGATTSVSDRIYEFCQKSKWELFRCYDGTRD